MKSNYVLAVFLTLFFGCSSTPIKNDIQEPSVLNEITSLEKKSGYIVKSTNKRILDSVKISDCVIYLDSFRDELVKIEAFTHSDKNGVEVYESLLSDKKAVVSSYYKKFTYAAAYRVPNTSTIYINLAKSSTYKSLTIALIHERLHVLDYKHQGNKRNKYDNINSVPYRVSVIAGKYVDECK